MREGIDNSSSFTVFSWVHCVFIAREEKKGTLQEQTNYFTGIYITEFEAMGMNFQHVSLKKILKKTTLGCEENGKYGLGILLSYPRTLFY